MQLIIHSASAVMLQLPQLISYPDHALRNTTCVTHTLVVVLLQAILDCNVCALYSATFADDAPRSIVLNQPLVQRCSSPTGRTTSQPLSHTPEPLEPLAPGDSRRQSESEDSKGNCSCARHPGMSVTALLTVACVCECV